MADPHGADETHDNSAILYDACRGPSHAHLHGGYTLCWGVDGDGNAWPIIADDRIRGTARIPYGESLEALAPHERLGRLPYEYELRLRYRCGAQTRAGHPCLAAVPTPGDRCHWHREAEQ